MRDVNERNRVIGEIFDELNKLREKDNKEFKDNVKEIQDNEEFSDETKTEQQRILQLEMSAKQSVIAQVMGALDKESKKVFFTTDEVLSQGFTAIGGELSAFRSQVSMELNHISTELKELKNVTKKLSKK